MRYCLIHQQSIIELKKLPTSLDQVDRKYVHFTNDLYNTVPWFYGLFKVDSEGKLFLVRESFNV